MKVQLDLSSIAIILIDISAKLDLLVDQQTKDLSKKQSKELFQAIEDKKIEICTALAENFRDEFEGFEYIPMKYK